MKKIIFILFILSPIFLITGCQKENENKNETSITSQEDFTTEENTGITITSPEDFPSYLKSEGDRSGRYEVRYTFDPMIEQIPLNYEYIGRNPYNLEYGTWHYGELFWVYLDYFEWDRAYFGATGPAGQGCRPIIQWLRHQANGSVDDIITYRYPNHIWLPTPCSLGPIYCPWEWPYPSAPKQKEDSIILPAERVNSNIAVFRIFNHATSQCATHAVCYVNGMQVHSSIGNSPGNLSGGIGVPVKAGDVLTMVVCAGDCTAGNNAIEYDVYWMHTEDSGQTYHIDGFTPNQTGSSCPKTRSHTYTF